MLRCGVVIVVLGMIAAGCGSSDRIARTTGGTPILQKSGELASTPSPLTLHDISEYPNGSPLRMLTTFLFLVQYGAAPGAVSYYGPNVRRTFGSRTIGLALLGARGAVEDAEIKIATPLPSASGDVVAITLLTSTGPPAHESYLVRKIDGNWKIAYDTLLAGSLPGVVATQRQQQISHTPVATPSAEALAAGQQAANQFTQLATPMLSHEHSGP